MRRALYAMLGTAAATSLLVGLKAQSHPRPDVAASAGSPAGEPGIAEAPAGAGLAREPTRPSPNGNPAGRGAGATGTFEGNRIPTPHGSVAVTVTMSAGRITDVKADVSGGGLDMQINAHAGPKLRQQVLARQSAKLDTVSGATYTSEAYRQSLQSALDKAAKRG